MKIIYDICKRSLDIVVESWCYEVKDIKHLINGIVNKHNKNSNDTDII